MAAMPLLSIAGPASAGDESGKLRGNNFYANCRFSHTSNDDPIVYPGEPGRSHHHTFFGNKSTDAYSTPASLRMAGTTCKPRADRGAYWVPTLYQNGHEIRPSKGQFYYNLRSFTDMHPFPVGLKIVAGNQHAHPPAVASCHLLGLRRGRGRAGQEGVDGARDLSDRPAELQVVR